jgi:hypothetical protein
MQHVWPLDIVVIDLGRLPDPVRDPQAAVGVIFVAGDRRRAVRLQEQRAVQAVICGVEVVRIRMRDPAAIALAHAKRGRRRPLLRISAQFCNHDFFDHELLIRRPNAGDPKLTADDEAITGKQIVGAPLSAAAGDHPKRLRDLPRIVTIQHWKRNPDYHIGINAPWACGYAECGRPPSISRRDPRDLVLCNLGALLLRCESLGDID